jgi:hypothetical protein
MSGADPRGRLKLDQFLFQKGMKRGEDSKSSKLENPRIENQFSSSSVQVENCLGLSLLAKQRRIRNEHPSCFQQTITFKRRCFLSFLLKLNSFQPQVREE